MSSNKSAFFCNPLSHAVAKNGSVLARSALDSDIMRFELQDFSALDSQIQQIAEQDVHTVFIEGGDGTVQGVLTGILSNQDKFDAIPNIVLLSGGMTNLVAANIGIKKPTPKKIKKLVDTPETAKQSVLPLLSVRPVDNDQSHYGFLFSSGAVPAATQYCLEKIHTQGISGAAAVRTTLFRVVMGRGADHKKILTPTALTLETDAATVSGDHLTSVATTLPKLMIGIKPFWGSEDGPVHLTYVGGEVKNTIGNVARMFKKSQSPKAKEALRKGGFQSWNIEDATLIHDGPLVLDGEVLPKTKGTIKLSTSIPLVFLS